jgi:hypothetical protein
LRTSFRPGASGNPDGRKPQDIELSKLARDRTEQSIAALARGLNDPEHYVAAAIAWLDSGWGKPRPETVRDVEGSIEAASRTETLESAEEWLARRRKELAALVAEVFATKPH